MTDKGTPGDSDTDDDEYALSERVDADGEEVAYCVWNGGAPGYSGSTRIYAYEGKFYIFNDGEFFGPFSSRDEAEDKFPVFNSVVDEFNDEDSAIVEIWDKDHGVIFQRKAFSPLSEYDERIGSLWVIDERFVTEPWVGGRQLGELPGYDTKGARLVRLTRTEIDEAVERYREENGHYPNT